MFAMIDTKGATHIAIYVPQEGAHLSLPALAGMLENNAVFIRKGWRELALCEPEMTIVLGDTIKTDESEAGEIMVVTPSSAVIDNGFVIASPEVLVSNKVALAKKEETIARISTELAHVKQQLAAANERIAYLLSQEVEG